jgi:dienelactone hydrolase
MTVKIVETEKNLSDFKVPYQINIYGAVEHSFALRGDSAIKEVKFATDQAFEQVVMWFKFWM